MRLYYDIIDTTHGHILSWHLHFILWGWVWLGLGWGFTLKLIIGLAHNN